MTQKEQTTTGTNPSFTENSIEADGFQIRYLEAGQGEPLIHLHGAGGLRLTPAHDLLSQQYHVIAFEMPGFGASPVNNQETMDELASTIGHAISNLGIDKFHLMGTSFGGKAALCLALQIPERVLTLVLEAPAAIRPKDARPPSRDPAAFMRAFHAHPERFTDSPRPDPELQAKTWPLVARLLGPNRDSAFEDRLRSLSVPTLVVFGTVDGVIPAEMGSIYKQLIPECSLILVYDAAHSITSDRPEAFTEVVVDYLQRHDKFVVSRRSTVLYP